MTPDRWCGVVILVGLALWLLWDIRDQHKTDVRVTDRLFAQWQRDEDERAAADPAASRQLPEVTR